MKQNKQFNYPKFLIAFLPLIISYIYYCFQIITNGGSFENQPAGILVPLIIFIIMLVFITKTSKSYKTPLLWSLPLCFVFLYLGYGHSIGAYSGWSYLEEGIIILLSIIVVLISFAIYTVRLQVDKKQSK